MGRNSTSRTETDQGELWGNYGTRVVVGDAEVVLLQKRFFPRTSSLQSTNFLHRFALVRFRTMHWRFGTWGSRRGLRPSAPSGRTERVAELRVKLEPSVWAGGGTQLGGGMEPRSAPSCQY
ncbi:hypothetical protein COCON_G00125750 [Conger conger]|uniref:Uncharacterized protein n=1 Tax=Conger conger TaxID=82655 RepID=A0A9Q1DCU4_CONCO|nr:hypothetical protein COCON_G00125750 [Conger conger]